MATRRRKPVQLELRPRTWGGKRDGAGRKAATGRRNAVHRAREVHVATRPVHVTMRAHRLVPWLRGQTITRRIVACIATASNDTFRIVQYSVQGNHVHLLVEATDRTRLARGMQGLAVRIARRVNGLLRRTGTFWGDRYHARSLRTPREVRHALVYVLMNHKKHERDLRSIDPCSSAIWFDGWLPAGFHHVRAERMRHRWLRALDSPVQPATTWLAATGWRRHGLVSLRDKPGTRL